MPCLKGVVSCAFTHSAFTNVECLAMGEYMQRCPFRPTFSQLECVPIAMLLKAHASVILHPAEIFFILNHLHCSLDDFCMTLISTKEEVKFDYKTGSLEPKPDDSATSQMVVQGIRKIYGVVFDKFELLRFIYRPTYEKYFESHIYNTYDVAS
ncbi:unnamed protein product [Cuscuta epithymum]|nr:unnamed protein product [Cuscuta epithymum]